MRNYLKASTAQLHLQVEAVLDLTGKIASYDRYCEMLKILSRFHAVTGAALEAAEWPDPGPDRRHLAQRRTWLSKDLTALGCDQQPHTDARLELTCSGETLGCLYVLEGSMLGGVVIARNARQSLGIDIDTGGRFFHGFGKMTAAEWANFLAVLDKHDVQITGPAALQGARKTFALFATLAKLSAD